MRLIRLLGPVVWFALVITSPVVAEARAPQSSMTAGAGVKLHLLDFGGEGSPIVLLAGAGSSAWVYSDFGQELAKKHRVLALTRRGHGESEQPKTGYSIEKMNDDLLAVLDSHKIARAILIGHSLAGEELTRFARSHPDRVAALVYLDAAFDRSIQGPVNEQDPVPQEEPTDADRQSVASYIAFTKRTRADLNRFWSPVLDREMAASIGKRPDGTIGWKMGPTFGEYWSSAAKAPPDYSGITAPSLAIYAVEDESYRLPANATSAQKEDLASYVSGPSAKWLETSSAQFKSGPGDREVVRMNAGHYLFIQRPAETLQVIEDFLSRKGL